MRKVDAACKKVRDIPLDEFAESVLGTKLYTRWKTQLYAEKTVCSIFKFYYRVKRGLTKASNWSIWAFQKYVLLDGVRAAARRKAEVKKVERWKSVKQAIEDELEKRNKEILEVSDDE